MYGDEEPRGDVVNYSLMASNDINLYKYENAYTNHLYMKDMEDEINSIRKNNTWELVEFPKDKKMYWLQMGL